MGLARILGVFAAFLFASSVAASTIDVGPSNWRNYGPSASHTTGGVKSTFGQSVRMPPTISGPTRILPVSRNAVIPYGSIANGLKNFVRVSPQSIAASAAVTGLFMAMDWAFDDDEGAWGKYEPETIEDDMLMLWSASVPGNTFYGWSPQVVGEQAMAVAYPDYEFTRCTIQSGTAAVCYGKYNDNEVALINTSRVGNCPAGTQYDFDHGVCFTIEGEFVVLNDGDFSQLQQQLPSFPAGQVSSAASDTQLKIGSPLPAYQDLTMTGPSSVSGPETTSTSIDPVTGDVTTTTTSTQTDISYGDTTITTTTTSTSTSYQNGQETSTTVTTETPGELPVASGGGASGDWPGFCEWASVVCDWLNWTQEDPPPEQDLPAVVDDDFYQEKSISFGSKSCPEPYSISLAPFMDSQVSISFQPLCDFAGLIYYMVMAASYIIAAYIMIGVARNA